MRVDDERVGRAHGDEVQHGRVEPVASGYLSLQSLIKAEGWILVPADSEGYPAGAEVMLRPWP